MTDPIADALTRIRNANSIYKEEVDMPFSVFKQEIIKILKEEGFIKGYKMLEDKKVKEGVIRVFLKYGPNKEKIINEIQRISRSGLRVYEPYKKIHKVYGGLGIAIVSTSKGILTDKQCREQKIGGEVLCQVW
jgi:small subunit ribosomal protein S8